jgi:hypothetical protein
MTVRLQRLTWSTSAPFRSGARSPRIRPVIRDGRGRTRPPCPVSCCLSARRPLLLGPSCSRRGVQRSSRSACRPLARPDPDGVPTFRWPETRPGWAPSMPRGRRCPRDWPNAPSRRLPLHSGQPLHPGKPTHRPGLTLTRRHQGFTRVHPSGLPLACSSRMERDPLGLNPGLRTPQLPATHARAGTDPEH